MQQRRLRVVGASVVLSAVVALGGCVDDSNATRAEVTTIAPASDDAAAALTICSALRSQANVMTGIANSAAAGIHAKTPEERYEALFDGFDRGADASDAFGDSLPLLDVPAIPERDDLLAQIAAGAGAAAAEFVDEQERFAAAVGSSVADGDAGGRVGQLFNSIEKANSLVEPVIARYERTALKRAFLDEPECRHVVQPFVLDE